MVRVNDSIVRMPTPYGRPTGARYGAGFTRSDRSEGTDRSYRDEGSGTSRAAGAGVIGAPAAVQPTPQPIAL
ncbi:MAG TPA: hypothetical protein VFH51_02965, partial [Myxococcota bacterium]|nr:hypothetical protein [Myxococcota bacterium]